MNADFSRIGLPLAQTTVESSAPVATSQQANGKGHPTSQNVETPWFANSWVPLILAMVVLYFFVFRSKNKQEKQRVKMLNELSKGDRIQTIGGIMGTVVETRENEVVVKVDETSNTKITFSRNAIHRVLEEEKK